jgi:hypothetical protein
MFRIWRRSVASFVNIPNAGRTGKQLLILVLGWWFRVRFRRLFQLLHWVARLIRKLWSSLAIQLISHGILSLKYLVYFLGRLNMPGIWPQWRRRLQTRQFSSLFVRRGTTSNLLLAWITRQKWLGNATICSVVLNKRWGNSLFALLNICPLNLNWLAWAFCLLYYVSISLVSSHFLTFLLGLISRLSLSISRLIVKV